ncbi:hypothetical protein K466DRAFT_601884 [Polyporus arcularius HHB13444]|uniref:Uncharacterized protein n=1 Tax=Polyporus arcularius HHB13444 TaxID=1314778 RepID=A0A5C3P526_9APHY|nr:hypothetical protein K466DRAFT_601884 [Polyporus arcularius HHB13444]
MSTPRPSLAEIHQMAQEMARKTTATWALKVYLWFADGARPHVAYIDVVTRQYEPVKIDSEDSIREVLVRRNINHVQFWNSFQASWIDGTVSDPIDVCIVSRHTLLKKGKGARRCSGVEDARGERQ